MMSRALVALLILLPLSSCYRVPRDIEPRVQTAVQDTYLKSLPSPFPPLSSTEKASRWGTEYEIGTKFAKNLDLYRAITALRRAEILAPEIEKERRLEMQYQILLCYYLGRRYDEVTSAYTTSGLSHVTTDFPAFHDLLMVLYESYEQLDNYDGACHILSIIRQYYPKTYENLTLSSALRRADFPELESIAAAPPDRPYLDDFLCCYENMKKSPATAAGLNAVLPGSGYLYLGQKQTALTAFLINGLFIAASVHFFMKGPIAAGIITAGFEMGWYFGGIQGASREATFYNERLYERNATPMMNKERLFPIFQLEFAF